MTIHIDASQVNHELQRLQAHLTPNGMQPAYADIGQILRSAIQDKLGEGKTPWGSDFDPLKKPRKRQGSRIAGNIPLNDTHQHIYNKITFQADNTGVEVGMFENVKIGETHQFGSSKKNIPARPFLPIMSNQTVLPSDWNQDILDIINQHLQSNP
jgi:phage virion morphogenesis protein